MHVIQTLLTTICLACVFFGIEFLCLAVWGGLYFSESFSNQKEHLAIRVGLKDGKGSGVGGFGFQVRFATSCFNEMRDLEGVVCFLNWFYFYFDLFKDLSWSWLRYWDCHFESKWY